MLIPLSVLNYYPWPIPKSMGMDFVQPAISMVQIKIGVAQFTRLDWTLAVNVEYKSDNYPPHKKKLKWFSHSKKKLDVI